MYARKAGKLVHPGFAKAKQRTTLKGPGMPPKVGPRPLPGYPKPPGAGPAPPSTGKINPIGPAHPSPVASPEQQAQMAANLDRLKAELLAQKDMRRTGTGEGGYAKNPWTGKPLHPGFAKQQRNAPQLTFRPAGPRKGYGYARNEAGEKKHPGFADKDRRVARRLDALGEMRNALRLARGRGHRRGRRIERFTPPS